MEGQTEQIPNLNYWFVLNRRSEIEYMYYGLPGDVNQSMLVKIFSVKTGIPDKKPTPLPKLLNRQYWNITGKKLTPENSETGTYFLTLDIPNTLKPPFGPVPYLECDGQCNWEVPGEFGLHGVNGDYSKLARADPGSSGCVRHKDEDIAWLYHVLDPSTESVRYYIENR